MNFFQYLSLTLFYQSIPCYSSKPNQSVFLIYFLGIKYEISRLTSPLFISQSSISSVMYGISSRENTSLTFSFHQFVFFHFKSRRWISLHEYQSKKILQENSLNVQRFQVVENPQDAKRAGEELSTHVHRYEGLVNNCFSFSENHRERISYQSPSLSWWSW